MKIGDTVKDSPYALESLRLRALDGHTVLASAARREYALRLNRRGTVTDVADRGIVTVQWDDGTRSQSFDYMVVEALS